MGDVLVKRREDQKKAKENRERAKERHLAAMGENETTPLNSAVTNPTYVSAREDVHENEFSRMMTNLFGVGTVDEEDKEESRRSDFPFDQRISLSEYEESSDECLWTAMPDSIVALNLTLACTKDLTDHTFTYLKAAFACGLLPLAMTFVIEFTSIMCLWEDNSDLRNSTAFCEQHPLLQLSVVGIFMLTLQGPLQDICIEAAIGLSSTKVCMDAHEGYELFIEGSGTNPGKGREFENIEHKPLIMKEVKTSWVSWIVYWISVGLEFLVWCLTLYVGVHYTLSQADASEIVQSAVAISFINEIDNMVYDNVASEQLKDFLAKAEYMVPIMKASGKTTYQSMLTRLSMQTPILCTITYFIVYTLRNAHCDPVTGGPIKHD
jgi:hypothetical protein